MTKVIVTGGAGFIGSHIVHHALERGYEVTVIDNLHSGHLSNIGYGNEVTFVNATITEPKAISNAFAGADGVFHLAARISVPESMQHPTAYFETNTLGTVNVLQCMQQHRVPAIVLSSTSAIYGDNPVLPKAETLLAEPQSPYAISKLDGEHLLAMQAKFHAVHAVSLRYFNVFGPRQDPNSAYAAAIPIFIKKALSNEDIVIFGDGEQTRDFVFVEDVVRANFAAMEKGSGVINVACGQTITINQLAQQIIDLTGSTSKILHAEERPGDVKHSCADNSKMRSQLGVTPQSDLEKGLTSTINYFEKLNTPA